jgi:WD40 repeat protein
VRQYKLKKLKRVHGVHFAPDGTRLFAVGGFEASGVDTAVWLDLATGANGTRIEILANCYAVDPQLTRYAIGGADEWATFQQGIAAVQWTALDGGVEWETFPAVRKKAPRFRDVYGLAFDPVGERLAVSHRTGVQSELSLMRLDTTERLDVSTDDAFNVIAFNADASRFVGANGMDDSRFVAVHASASQKKLFEFVPPGTVTRAALFLPDDRLVVANGRYVYVLPATGGEPQFTLAGHPKQVNAVALAPDGRRVLSASHDGSIKTWDADTGEPGPAFEWGIGPVTALAFAPDGLTCAAAGLNGKVVVWDVDG